MSLSFAAAEFCHGGNEGIGRFEGSLERCHHFLASAVLQTDAKSFTLLQSQLTAQWQLVHVQ